MSVAIVKYNAGNIQSLLFALERLGVEGIVTDDPYELGRASHVIFPGVGEASSAMSYLTLHGLDKVILSLKNPVLGICLGLQLLCSSSEEGEVTCLGVFPQVVRRITGVSKVPHVGWNSVTNLTSPLFSKIEEEAYVYFVHSYAVPSIPSAAALTDYGGTFSSALARENFYGVQFHPERSGPVGEQLLRNFLAL